MAQGQSTSHTQADGGHKASFPPFESSTFASQLVSLTIAFGLLYLIVSRLALPRVGGILAARKQVLDTDLAEAAKLKADSDAALKSYETELANARAKAQAMASEVREKLNAEQDAAKAKLEESLNAKLASLPIRPPPSSNASPASRRMQAPSTPRSTRR